MNVVLTPATIAKLDLGPDDIVIVRSTVNLDPEHCNYITTAVRDAIGEGHRILFLTPNLSIDVIARRPKGEDLQATEGMERS